MNINRHSYMRLYYYSAPSGAFYCVQAASTVQAATMINRQMKKEQTGHILGFPVVLEITPMDVRVASHWEVISVKPTVFAGAQ